MSNKLHVYTPHKDALTRRTKELAQAARRLLKEYEEERRFMEHPSVGLVDVFEHEVKRCVEDTLSACARLQEYVGSVPDEPVED